MIDTGAFTESCTVCKAAQDGRAVWQPEGC